jgi:hypothetical protein
MVPKSRPGKVVQSQPGVQAPERARLATAWVGTWWYQAYDEGVWGFCINVQI